MRLLVVTLCCFVAPPIAPADPTEDAVIKAIKQLHGRVEQNGKVVDLSYTQVTDAELKALAALKNLTTLNLSETRVTDAGLKELAALKNLTTLNLSETRVTNAGLKELAALKNLTTLYVRGTGPHVIGAPDAEQKVTLPGGGNHKFTGPGAHFAKAMTDALKAQKIDSKLHFYEVATGSTYEYTFPNGVKRDVEDLSAEHHVIVEVEVKSGNKLETLYLDSGISVCGAMQNGNVGDGKTGVIAPANQDLRDKHDKRKKILREFDPSKATRKPLLNDAGVKELAALKSLTTLDLSLNNVTAAGLKELATLKNLSTLNLSRTNVADADLEELAALKNLRTLDLSWTNVTDAGLKKLAALKNLATLDLSATTVTGAEMRELAVLKNLTTLYLRGPGAHMVVPPAAVREPSLNDAGAKGLAALESLTTLDLSLNHVTAAILKELAALKNLIALNLSGTRVTDAEMKELAALRNLRILYLFGSTNLTDDGVKQLATLKNLTILDLTVTTVSDTGLMELSAVQGLAHLCVAGTHVTDAGVKDSRQRNPKCDLSVPSWSDAIKR
jgi:Leucine-rich repeat (LRR) protein